MSTTYIPPVYRKDMSESMAARLISIKNTNISCQFKKQCMNTQIKLHKFSVSTEARIYAAISWKNYSVVVVESWLQKHFHCRAVLKEHMNMFCTRKIILQEKVYGGFLCVFNKMTSSMNKSERLFGGGGLMGCAKLVSTWRTSGTYHHRRKICMK